jgi:hypothetical protein
LPALQGSEFILAVHIRHPDPSDSGENDLTGELACVASTLAGFGVSAKGQGSQQRPCVVLLASDRVETITRLSAQISGLGCAVRVADHLPPLDAADPLPAPQSKEAYKEGRGPWRDSLSSVADLELLQHADAFIGSSLGEYSPVSAVASSSSQPPAKARDAHYLSAFGMLAASLVVTNGRPVVPWVGPAGASPPSTHPEDLLGPNSPHRVRFLPTCGPSFGSYLAVKPKAPESPSSDATGLPLNGDYRPSTCPFFTWRCDDFNATAVQPLCVPSAPMPKRHYRH